MYLNFVEIQKCKLHVTNSSWLQNKNLQKMLMSFHFTFKYLYYNWRVSLSKICHERTNKAVTHENIAANEWVTMLFGHEYHQLVISSHILLK